MTYKIKMHTKTDEGYAQILPETVVSQVIDEKSGLTLEQILDHATSIKKTVISRFNVIATVDNQMFFEFEDGFYDANKNDVEVYLNGEFLHPNEEFTVSKNEGDVFPSIILFEGVPVGTKLHIAVSRDVVTGDPSSGFSKTQMLKKTFVTTTEGETQFDLEDPQFYKENDSTMVFVQAEPLIEGDEYTVSDTGSIITLTEALPIDTIVHVIVLRDVPIVDETSGFTGDFIADGTINEAKLSPELIEKIDSAKQLGNSVKQNMVSSLLSKDESLPITPESSWDEIRNSIQDIKSGMESDGSVVCLSDRINSGDTIKIVEPITNGGFTSPFLTNANKSIVHSKTMIGNSVSSTDSYVAYSDDILLGLYKEALQSGGTPVAFIVTVDSSGDGLYIKNSLNYSTSITSNDTLVKDPSTGKVYLSYNPSGGVNGIDIAEVTVNDGAVTIGQVNRILNPTGVTQSVLTSDRSGLVLMYVNSSNMLSLHRLNTNDYITELVASFDQVFSYTPSRHSIAQKENGEYVAIFNNGSKIILSSLNGGVAQNIVISSSNNLTRSNVFIDSENIITSCSTSYNTGSYTCVFDNELVMTDYISASYFAAPLYLIREGTLCGITTYSPKTLSIFNVIDGKIGVSEDVKFDNSVSSHVILYHKDSINTLSPFNKELIVTKTPVDDIAVNPHFDELGTVLFSNFINDELFIVNKPTSGWSFNINKMKVVNGNVVDKIEYKLPIAMATSVVSIEHIRGNEYMLVTCLNASLLVSTLIFDDSGVSVRNTTTIQQSMDKTIKTFKTADGKIVVLFGQSGANKVYIWEEALGSYPNGKVSNTSLDILTTTTNLLEISSNKIVCAARSSSQSYAVTVGVFNIASDCTANTGRYTTFSVQRGYPSYVDTNVYKTSDNTFSILFVGDNNGTLQKNEIVVGNDNTLTPGTVVSTPFNGSGIVNSVRLKNGNVVTLISTGTAAARTINVYDNNVENMIHASGFTNDNSATIMLTNDNGDVFIIEKSQGSGFVSPIYLSNSNVAGAFKSSKNVNVFDAIATSDAERGQEVSYINV